MLSRLKKTTNLIINFDHDDDWILNDDDATLESVGIGESLRAFRQRTSLNQLPHIENEYELSFFNRELYDAFKINPTQSW